MSRPGLVTRHRPARAVPAPIECATVTIAAPPSVPEQPGNAVWQVLAPALGSLGMLGFAVVIGETRYLIMAGVFAGLMIISGATARVVQARVERRRRDRVAERYRAHLADAHLRLDRGADIQRTTAEYEYPATRELLSAVVDAVRVWERRPDHHDFLTIRLGLGDVASDVSPLLEGPSDPFSDTDPDLLEAARRVTEATSAIDDMPITVDLRDVGCLAIVGDRAQSRALVRSVLSQLCVLRAPADLGVFGWVETSAIAEWDWVKWLPHCRATLGESDDGATMWTSRPEEFALLLRKIVMPRLRAAERRHATAEVERHLRSRQLIMVIDHHRPAPEGGHPEILDQTIDAGRDIGVVAMCLVESPDQIPSGATASVTISPDGTVDYVDLRCHQAALRGVTADQVDSATAAMIARSLAPLCLRSDSARASRDGAGLLDLLSISPTDLDPARTWATTAVPLATHIGVLGDGEPLELDLREASAGGMGPHGVLIGATGSGKSELLRTLVLGLALQNHPDEVSFVFADFKGGATFAGLDAIPHVAGSVTNIESDPRLIDRMQDALGGEMHRRQRVLRAHRFDRADEYRDHRRTVDPELDPLPALVIVVDEFGELLAVRPEFTELFTSIGRAGRSLGIHLLLASQRLDENRIRAIEAHLRYRICLRTFSADDSLAAIGSRASFELPPIPGLGHVAVDGDVKQFRAGLVNRPVRRATSDDVDREATVRQFDLRGPSHPIGSARGDAAPRETRRTTEMELITSTLAGAADRTRQVWLAPLREALAFSPIETTPELNIVIGESDLPAEQLITPAIHDFSGGSGHLAVVGGPRSGKSTTLATMLASLAYRHAPDEVSAYVIDLGGGALHGFDVLPHVGAVFGRGDREEIARLIRQLGGLVAQRVEVFRKHRLRSMVDFTVARAEGRLESDLLHVFLIIDQWGVFEQEFGHELSDAVTDILNGGLHYGVHVILSAGRWQDIRMSLRDSIGGRLELRLTDPVESEIDRKAAHRLPSDTPGRALDTSGTLTQVMLPPADLQSIASRWRDRPPVPRVAVLPTKLDAHDIAAIDPGAIGVEESGLAPWRPELTVDEPHFVIVGDGRSGKTAALRGLLSSLAAKTGVVPSAFGLIDYRAQLTPGLPRDSIYRPATSPDAAANLVASIVAEVGNRSPSEPVIRRPIVLMIDDYDLVVGGSPNPLSALADIVPLGGDRGFHLVIARRTAGLARSAFEPVLRRLKEMSTPTLILDGDPAEGPIAGSVRASPQPVGRGVLVERSRTTLIQLADFRPENRLPERRLHAIDRDLPA